MQEDELIVITDGETGDISSHDSSSNKASNMMCEQESLLLVPNWNQLSQKTYITTPHNFNPLKNTKKFPQGTRNT